MSAPANPVQKPPLWLIKKNAQVYAHAHTVSGLSQKSLLVWKATAGYNNYSLASLLVVAPLFQQSGFSLPLDRDQVRLHNTLLCLERVSEKERENCRHLSFCLRTNA